MIKTLRKRENSPYYEFFIYDSYDELKKDSHLFFYRRQYLYCLELSDGKAIKIGYSGNLNNRLKQHIVDSKSPFFGKVGRIGVLGPIRDGLNSEEIIHSRMTPYFVNEYGISCETYSFDKLFENNECEKQKALDIFNNIAFPIIQSLCHDDYDDNGNYRGFELILEDNTISDKERKLLETTIITAQEVTV